MAAVSWGEVAPAAAARALAGSYVSGTETALHAAIASAINTAIASPLKKLLLKLAAAFNSLMTN